MDAITENKTLHFRSVYQDTCDEFELDEAKHVLLSHFGVLSNELIMKLSDEFRALLISKGADQSIKRRVYSIMIEGLQSFMIHGSVEKSSGKQLCFLIISEAKKFFQIVLCNVIKTDEKTMLVPYIEKINSESSDELNQRYVENLGGPFLENAGSGLGFINARIKSGNPIEVSFLSLNEKQELMMLKIKVNKPE